jgi:hypothetical protein
MFPSACSGVAINDDGSNTRQKCDVDIHDGLDDSAFWLQLHLGPGHLLSLHSSSARPCSAILCRNPRRARSGSTHKSTAWQYSSATIYACTQEYL